MHMHTDIIQSKMGKEGKVKCRKKIHSRFKKGDDPRKQHLHHGGHLSGKKHKLLEKLLHD